MKSKNYYKVCAIYPYLPNKYYSFNCRPSDDIELCIEYIPNQWVVPIIPKSRLFCFESIGEARDFRNHCGSSDAYSNIFTCYVKNPVHIKYIGDPCVNHETIRSFIETHNKKYSVHAPVGTISASSIMIIDKIS